MKYFNLVLFFLAVANMYTAAAEDDTCVTCEEFTEMFNIINEKLDTINGNCSEPAGEPTSELACKPLNFQNLEATTAKLVINSVRGPFGAIAEGNDVYISGYYDTNVYRFNQETNQGSVAAGVVSSPSGRPTFFDIKDEYLYMTTFTGNAVYRKNLHTAGSKFEKIISMKQPVGISWSPNGKELLISEWSSGTILVFNENFKLINRFPTGVKYVREISFDSDGNIRISTYTKEIRIFDKNTYRYKSVQRIKGAVYTEGYTVHCDGTIVVADRSGKLFFLNKDYEILKTVTGYRGLGDVAITKDGTLYVTDFSANKIYLYTDLF